MHPPTRVPTPAPTALLNKPAPRYQIGRVEVSAVPEGGKVPRTVVQDQVPFTSMAVIDPAGFEQPFGIYEVTAVVQPQMRRASALWLRPHAATRGRCRMTSPR
jgi:hypothetical protein